MHGHGQELLSIYTHIGVRPRKDLEQKGNKASTTDGYWIVKRGDFIVNKLLAWMGAVGVSHYDGVTSPAYDILRPVTKLHPDYYHNLLRTKIYLQQFKCRSRGIMDMRLRLYFDQFGQIPLLVPPLNAQAAVVRFLDHANRKFDGFIRAKRKLIALLNEQKQAIIHRAVTRGLNPDVKLKPSGLPWLGDIPAHWETRKIKSLVSTVGGMTPSKSAAEFWGGRIPWVSPKDMKVREIWDSRDHITNAALRQTGVSLIQPPAVLIVVRGMILARTFPTAITKVPVTVNQDMKALLPRPNLLPDYFVSLLTGIQRDLLQLVEIAGHGTCCLRTDSWENLVLPLPPLNEQEAIGAFLASELLILNTAIARTEREIALMQEYRTHLTADIVTGKLDVREAAAKLPESEDAAEPFPEADTFDEDPLEEADAQGETEA